jgi:hypothetical protein
MAFLIQADFHPKFPPLLGTLTTTERATLCDDRIRTKSEPISL